MSASRRANICVLLSFISDYSDNGVDVKDRKLPHYCRVRFRIGEFSIAVVEITYGKKKVHAFIPTE